MKSDELNTTIYNDFLKDVSDVLLRAQKNAKTSANLSMVYAYFEIGRMIVEEEQHGENRAAYGKQIYSNDQIGETVFSQFENLPTVYTGRKFF